MRTKFQESFFRLEQYHWQNFKTGCSVTEKRALTLKRGPDRGPRPLGKQRE